MADPEILKKPEYFGKYGKIIKVSIMVRFSFFLLIFPDITSMDKNLFNGMLIFLKFYVILY